MLREERLSQNRTLADIADETCISSRYLEAIENDDLKILPGNFFYRSFIKQYANALQLDDQATGNILSHAVPMREADPLPAFTLAYQTAKTEGRLSGLYRPRTAVAVVLLATVLIGCSGLYAIWRNAQVEQETSPQTPAVPQASAEPQQPAPAEPNPDKISPQSETKPAEKPDLR